MSPSTRVRTPLAHQHPGDSLAAPATVGQGACTRHSLRASFFRFLSLLRITCLAMPMAITTTSTMASQVTGPDTSMPFIEVSLWWLLMFSASLLAVVIFHWVIVPLFAWIERRYS